MDPLNAKVSPRRVEKNKQIILRAAAMRMPYGFYQVSVLPVQQAMQ
jgi:hypothetical protein